MATTARSRTGWPGGSSPPTRSVRRAARGFQCRVRHPGRPAWPAVSRFSTAAATTSLARMDAGEKGADGARGAVLGQVIPKRRFTRWAAWYFLVWFCLPVLALGAAVDALLYLVFTALLGHTTAIFCLPG